MAIQLLPPLDLGSLLGLGGDPGARADAGGQETQTEIAQRNVLGNPGGTGGLIKSLLGIGPNGATLAAEAEALKAQRQQAQLTAARNAAIMNPTAENFSRLFILDPASRESIKAAHDSLDAEHQRTQLEEWSALRGYAAAGDVDGFKARAQRQIDADRAAGQDTTDEERVLAMADKPEGLRAVGGFIDSKLAAVMGPDKWGEAFKPQQEADKLELERRKQAEVERSNLAKENAPVVVGEGGALVQPGTPGAPAPGTGGTGAASGPTPAPTGGVYDQIDAVAAQAGATPEEQADLRRTAQVESGGDPKARNGSSRGLFQFHPDTFAHAGGGDINSVADQTKAELNLMRQNRVALQHAGVPVNGANLYIMHQQGTGGGLALLTAPQDVNAVSALTPAYRNPKTAEAAIVNNGGKADMTAGQFRDYWNARWSGGKGGQAQTAQTGGARVLYDNTKATKPGWRPSTPEEIAAVHLPPGTPAQTSPDGKVEPLSQQSVNLKPIPASVGLAIADRRQVISKIDRALALVHENPEHVGIAGYVPDPVLQRIDPGGVNTRAAVGEIGSQIIHDRSGAAVTFSEMPRLKPFVPTAKDSADTIITKLNRLRENVSGELGSMQEEFGPDSGYRQPSATINKPPDAASATPRGTVNHRAGPGGQFPVFTREQALAAAQKPSNKGKQFYLEGDDALKTFH
jgi:hypothetical protein